LGYFISDLPSRDEENDISRRFGFFYQFTDSFSFCYRISDFSDESIDFIWRTIPDYDGFIARDDISDEIFAHSAEADKSEMSHK